MTKTAKKPSTTVSRSRESSNAGASIANPNATSEPEATAPPAASKAPCKQQQLAELIVRDEGATLEQMIAMTGWLPHTTRASLTGLKKKGYVISSDKVDGVRTYRAVAPE